MGFSSIHVYHTKYSILSFNVPVKLGRNNNAFSPRKLSPSCLSVCFLLWKLSFKACIYHQTDHHRPDSLAKLILEMLANELATSLAI